MRIYMPNFEKRGGLITVVVQCVHTRRVLMVAHARKQDFLDTLRTGKTVFFSTTRKERWPKGEKSGNYQICREILINCDGSAIVCMVEQWGMTCHTGAPTCFYRKIIENGLICAAPEAMAADNLPVIEAEIDSNFRRMFER